VGGSLFCFQSYTVAVAPTRNPRTDIGDHVHVLGLLRLLHALHRLGAPAHSVLHLVQRLGVVLRPAKPGIEPISILFVYFRLTGC
jgi:hypothetical protein